MANIIVCPNCGYQQKKYVTLVQETLVTCVKCNFKWVNLKTQEKKAPNIKVIMESENHYNYTLQNFAKGEKSFPVYALNSSFVEPLGAKANKSLIEKKIPNPPTTNSNNVISGVNADNVGLSIKKPNSPQNHNYHDKEFNNSYQKGGANSYSQYNNANSFANNHDYGSYRNQSGSGHFPVGGYNSSSHTQNTPMQQNQSMHDTPLSKNKYDPTFSTGQHESYIPKNNPQVSNAYPSAQQSNLSGYNPDAVKTHNAYPSPQQNNLSGYNPDAVKTHNAYPSPQQNNLSGYNPDAVKTHNAYPSPQQNNLSGYNPDAVKAHNAYPSPQQSNPNTPSGAKTSNVLNKKPKEYNAFTQKDDFEHKKSYPNSSNIPLQNISLNAQQKAKKSPNLNNYDEKDIANLNKKYGLSIKSGPSEAIIPKEPSLLKKPKEFTYSNNRLNKIREEIRSYYNEEKIINDDRTPSLKTKAILKEMDDIFTSDTVENKNHQTDLLPKNEQDPKKKGKIPNILNILGAKTPNSEKNKLDIENVNLDNRSVRNRLSDIINNTDLQNMQKDMVDSYEKEQKKRLKAVAYPFADLDDFNNPYAKDLDISLHKQKKRRKKMNFLRDDLSYKELIEHIKNKYLNFDNPKNVMRIAVYAILVTTIILGANYGRFLTFSPPKIATTKIDNTAVSSIPVIDENDLMKAINSLGGDYDLPLIINNSKLSNYVNIEDMYLTQENEDKETVVLNTDDLLQKAQTDSTRELLPNIKNLATESIIASIGGKISGAFSNTSLNIKRISFNSMNDLNISKTSLSWTITSFNENIVETSAVITNKTRNKSYNISSLEIIYTDIKGNVVTTKTINPNKTLVSLESFKVIFKAPDLPVSITNAYIFISHYHSVA